MVQRQKEQEKGKRMGSGGGVGWLLYLCVFLIARKWIANSVRCHPSFLVTDCWAAFPDMTCQVPTSLDYFTSNSWFPFRPQCLCTAYSGLEQGLRPMLSLLKHVPRLYFTSWNSPSPSVLAMCTTATARVLLHTYLRMSVSSLRACGERRHHTILILDGSVPEHQMLWWTQWDSTP